MPAISSAPRRRRKRRSWTPYARSATPTETAEMAVTRVVMPKLSEQMDSGKVIKWLKKEGDRVQSGDILAEVETDKADVEMEAFGGGVLRKILVSAGDKAPVGSLIGVIAEENSVIGETVAQADCGATPA